MQLAAAGVGRQPQIGQGGLARKAQGFIEGKPLAVGGLAQEAVKGEGMGGRDQTHQTTHHPTRAGEAWGETAAFQKVRERFPRQTTFVPL